MVSRELLVVKYGSSCVAGPDGIDQERIDGYAEQIAMASDKYDVVVVSSGSIAVGEAMWESRDRMSWGDKPGDGDGSPPSKQVLASIGSAPAVVAWQEAFRNQRIMAGQIQVTHHEVRDRQEGPMLMRTMQECLSHNVVSVVNENDALSDEEIKALRYGGDNDGLARYVAALLEADRLCLLTADQEGLLDENGKVVNIVKSRDSRWALSLAGEASKKGTGGMRTKVQAAIAAAASGIRTHIAKPDWPLTDILERRHGTYFPPH